MKIKLQYIIIAILVVTNIYFILDGKTKSYGSDNSEFKREMNYLETVSYTHLTLPTTDRV